MDKLEHNKISIIIKLYQQGISYTEIAKQVNCSISSIVKYCKINNVYKKRISGRKTGHIPWNKGKIYHVAIGNKYAFIGDKAKKNTGNKRAQNLFKSIQPCSVCNRILESFQMIRHHKDENTLNNSIENIVFMCRSCHAKHHHASNNIKRFKKRI